MRESRARGARCPGRELLRAPLGGHWQPHVAFAADGTVLAGQGNTVTLLAPGAEPVSVVGKFDGHESPIAALAEVAPGLVVTGHHDGALRRVDLAPRKFARTGFEAHGCRVQALAVGTTPGSFWTSGSWLLAERHVDDSDRPSDSDERSVRTGRLADASRVGSVAVTVHDGWARVLAPGGRTCETPCQLTLPVGSYAVRLELSSGGVVTRRVRIREGATTTIVETVRAP